MVAAVISRFATRGGLALPTLRVSELERMKLYREESMIGGSICLGMLRRLHWRNPKFTPPHPSTGPLCAKINQQLIPINTAQFAILPIATDILLSLTSHLHSMLHMSRYVSICLWYKPLMRLFPLYATKSASSTPKRIGPSGSIQKSSVRGLLWS